MKSMIDHKELLNLRFDLVLRYHILEKCGFNFRAAHKSLHKGDFRFLEDKLIELRNQYRESLYLFREKNWVFVDKMIRERPTWIEKHPQLVTADRLAVNVKRLVMSLRHKKSLYWAMTYDHPIEKTEIRAKIIWKKETYKHELSSAQFHAFEETEERMLKGMSELDFFSEATLIKNVCCPVTDKQKNVLKAIPKMPRWNEFKMWKFWRDLWLKFWLCDFKGSSRDNILDFGCGSCWNSFVGKSLGYRHIINLDIDTEEVKACFPKYNKILKQKVQLWDGNEMPFVDDRFDAVVTRAALMKLIDTDFGIQIKESCRVTKPCGVWYISLSQETVAKFTAKMEEDNLFRFVKKKNITLSFFQHDPVPKKEE